MGSEAVIRLGFFFGILVLVAIWELLAPKRPDYLQNCPLVQQFEYCLNQYRDGAFGIPYHGRRHSPSGK